MYKKYCSVSYFAVFPVRVFFTDPYPLMDQNNYFPVVWFQQFLYKSGYPGPRISSLFSSFINIPIFFHKSSTLSEFTWSGKQFLSFFYGIPLVNGFFQLWISLFSNQNKNMFFFFSMNREINHIFMSLQLNRNS